MFRASLITVLFGISILIGTSSSGAQVDVEEEDSNAIQSAVHTDWRTGYNSYDVQMTLAAEVPGLS